MRKRRCRHEDCELLHCRRCGSHYEAMECEACAVERAFSETEAVVKAFGGNAEEAAKAMGW